jgi:hypothetical protein
METWSCICDVDAAPLIAWYADSCASLPIRLGQRSHELPMPLVHQVTAEVLKHFAGPVLAHGPFLGFSVAGHSHPMHTDPQRDDWLTRVHVPIVTNPQCWHQWEGGERVHFEVGKAYSFNTLVPHALGNEGTTDRVHFIFEVLRGG